MDSTSTQRVQPKQTDFRPDSLKIDLQTIPENGSVISFGQSVNLVNVGFRNLCYSVTNGIFRKTRRNILKNVNGDFHAGELTAIMGPSGAGKSTLMNIIAGYTTYNVTGELLLNDEKREEYNFRTQSCYIMQNDNLQPLLTVEESMTVAANLKFSSDYSQKEKQSKIKDILDAVSLWDNRKVKAYSLSGGQKKRLSIALELLKNPQVMFFDEPTSGLDSLTSKQCVMLLKKLAATGRTIICTIHQPSAMVFEMFDHLYALSEGKCIYQGSIKNLLPYFEGLDLKCPTYHNPADFLLEVITGEHGDFFEQLVEKSRNGLCSDWRQDQRNTLQFQSLEHVDKMMQNGRITPVKAPPILFPNCTNKNRQSSKGCCSSQYPTTYSNQICVLLKRAFLILSRDKTLTYSRLGTHLSIAIFIGILYYGIGRDASNIPNNFNYLFFTIMFLMMTAFNCVVTTFPSELPIITRENFNKWYSLKSYYLAISVSDIPVQMLATLIYAFVTYILTMQPLEPFRIFAFMFMCMLISLVAQSYGLLIGAILDLKSGVIFGPFFFLPCVIFSGFFIPINNAPFYMKFLFHGSFLKYALEGLTLSIFGYGREKLPCNVDFCHYVYPRNFLKSMAMDKASYTYGVIFLLLFTLVIRIGTYFALKAQIKRRKPLSIIS